jgi:5-(carboxyamino)imidazole ribonucleotide synthase
LDKKDDLANFLKNVDSATIESEFLNTTLVKEAIEKTKFEPSLKILERLQDRLTQKHLLDEFSVPTSPFESWNGEISVDELAENFKKGVVLKKRRFGYDGYGTFVFKKGETGAVKSDAFGYIAEEFVPFKRELAFSIARNQKNEFAVFPLVQTCQVNSRCFWVKGPVKHPKFKSLVNKFKKLLTGVDYRGILAVELFDSKGKLIVNELAPRVHNSAHYSMDALSMSQFEAHWRGILGWPLKNPEPLSKGFAMVNLLGEHPKAEFRLSKNPSGRLHWYGKAENRVGRKMGHINTFGRSPDEALTSALKWRKEFTL